jgi:hypothetical protein
MPADIPSPASLLASPPVRITLFEAFLAIAFNVIADALDLIALIPLIGLVFALPAVVFGGLVWFATQFWLYMKKARGVWYLAGSLIDQFSLFLPLRTFSIITVIVLTNVTARAARLAAEKGVSVPGLHFKDQELGGESERLAA